MSEQPEQQTSEHFYIVGIGASAGGVQALKEFFENVSPDSGMAYVVILHLSPDHDSHLTSLLQTVTTLPVQQVLEKTKVQPNQVYVIPPNQHLTMEDGMLVVSVNMMIEDRRAPVDIFFRTLAESHTTRAVAVVLSGTGANGSMGLKRVKERGGAVYVQNPREAEFSEMPRNAIATELVDEVLPVADIPDKIFLYKQSQAIVHIPLDAAKPPQDQQQALREIFTQLRLRTGHDFSNYKRPTLLRRIERRISIHNLPDLPAYTAYLQQHPDEITNLLKDLLISVTNFFRDKRAFEEVENTIMPLIFQDKSATDQIRIWVAGCATGEEAYSLAMLCAERMAHGPDSPQVQIFATDIDETAIATAREGLYTLNDAADVSPERLRRFFSKENDGYRIRREIREMVLFANHNFLKDPPFSHLNLITCRNVLIYLNHTAQERVMETFHFALNPGGYMFLGTSESADGATDLYSTFSREHHIFQSRQTGARNFPVPEANPSFRRYEQPTPTPATTETQGRTMERITYGDLHQRLLEEYAPPSMVVNEEYDIVHVSERAGRYLQISGGELSRNLLKLVRPELRLELRSALYQASQRQAPVEVKGLQLRIDESTETINIQVRPVLREDDTAKGFILVVFSPADPGTPEETIYTSEEPASRHLEDELMRLKVQLRSSNEHHEFQAEELKAANEELQAMNEEMRSAAEELETSKEELQSINEELTTVNQELKVKIEEVSMANNNLQNLINSTDLGTIFLDRSFRVVLFTPSTRSLFNLIPADYGRPLSDITSKLVYDGLIADAEQVLEKLQTVEREVTTTDDRVFLMRMLPYRTAEDRIKGVVITFIDITTRIQAEEALRQTEEQYRHQLEKDVADRTAELKESQQQYKSLIENTPDIVIRWDKDLRVQFANSALEAKTGNANDTTLGKTKAEMGQPADIALLYMDKLRQVFATAEELEYFNNLTTLQGELPLLSRMVPEKNEAGEVVTVLSIGRDISELQNAQQEIIAVKEELAQRATDRYQTLFNTIDEGFCIIEVLFDENGVANDFRFLEANPAFERQAGLSNAIGKTVKELIPDLELHWLEVYGQVARTGTSIRYENEVHALKSYYDVYAFPYGNPKDHQVGALFNDITKRKHQEASLAFLAEMSNELTALNNIADTMAFIGEKIGTFFGVKWCVFSELREENEISVTSYGWNHESVPSLKGTYRVQEFLTPEQFEKNKAGELTVCNDVTTDPCIKAVSYTALDIHSFIIVPLARNGQWQFQLSIIDNRPRLWLPEEVALLKELSSRIWTRLERAQAEEALKQSEERFRSYITASSDIVYRMSADWKNMHQLEGKTFLKDTRSDNTFWLDGYIPVAEKQRVAAAVDEAIGQKKIFELEHHIINAEGNLGWAYSRAIPKLNEQGEIVEWVGVTSDITERKNAEEALRLAEERYRTVLESADLGAWDWNIPEDSVIWNKEHYDLLGADPAHQPMNSAYFMQFVYPDDAERIRNILYEAVVTKGIYDAEFRIVRGDTGEIRWVSGFGRVADAKDGQATRMVGVMSDITGRKQAEQQREDFLSIASHELKTPVTSIKVYGQLLQESFEAGGDTRSLKMMNKLNLQVDRLSILIGNLLDTTSISEGQLALNLTSFNYDELIADRIEDMQRLSPLHRLVIHTCPGAIMTADRERISQVLINLVGNAIKYSPPNTEILISCQVEGDRVKLSVKDQGIGIPEDVQQKVFDRFFRIKENRIKSFPGLGLGLYITAGIVHRHGGSIGLESKEGEGTTFWFTLPLGEGEQ